MNFLNRTVFLVAAVALLSGCAAYESINAMVEEQRRKDVEARLALARVACESYGFRAGTDSYAQCTQTEVNQILNREAMADAARKAAYAAEAAAKKSMTCQKDMLGHVKCIAD